MVGFTTSAAPARESRSMHIVDPDVSTASSLVKEGMNTCSALAVAATGFSIHTACVVGQGDKWNS